MISAKSFLKYKGHIIDKDIISGFANSVLCLKCNKKFEYYISLKNKINEHQAIYGIVLVRNGHFPVKICDGSEAEFNFKQLL